MKAAPTRLPGLNVALIIYKGEYPAYLVQYSLVFDVSAWNHGPRDVEHDVRWRPGG